VSDIPVDADPDIAAWPEGSAYASYCLGVALSVLDQDFNGAPPLSNASTDRRLWQSVRENIKDNPDYAIPFFDLMIGQIPNWQSPSLPDRRPAVLAKQIAAA
jgi:hypothetical protein